MYIRGLFCFVKISWNALKKFLYTGLFILFIGVEDVDRTVVRNLRILAK